MRSFTYSSVQPSAARAAATAADRDRQPLLGQVVHEVDEALALGRPEQVRDRHLHVGEEQLGGVLRVLADLFEVAATLEARPSRARGSSSDMPLCFCDGSVLTAVMTRSALMPLVMKVLEPLTT